MKAIRVTNEYHNPRSDVPVIEIGTRVTVIQEKLNRRNGELHYQLLEVPPCIEPDGIQVVYWYDARGFATLPDPSEEVAIEHEQEAIIYQR